MASLGAHRPWAGVLSCPLVVLRPQPRSVRRVAVRAGGEGGEKRAAAARSEEEAKLLTPFDDAARSAERALADARAILLATRRALDDQEAELLGAAPAPVRKEAARAELWKAERELSALEGSLEKVKLPPQPMLVPPLGMSRGAASAPGAAASAVRSSAISEQALSVVRARAAAVSSYLTALRPSLPPAANELASSRARTALEALSRSAEIARKGTSNYLARASALLDGATKDHPQARAALRAACGEPVLSAGVLLALALLAGRVSTTVMAHPATAAKTALQPPPTVASVADKPKAHPATTAPPKGVLPSSTAATATASAKAKASAARAASDSKEKAAAASKAAAAAKAKADAQAAAAKSAAEAKKAADAQTAAKNAAAAKIAAEAHATAAAKAATAKAATVKAVAAKASQAKPAGASAAAVSKQAATPPAKALVAAAPSAAASKPPAAARGAAAPAAPASSKSAPAPTVALAAKPAPSAAAAAAAAAAAPAAPPSPGLLLPLRRPAAPLPDAPAPSSSLRAAYAFQSAFAADGATKALLFTAFAATVVAAGGLAYSLASKEPLKVSALKAYSILNNVPGTDVMDAPTPAGALTAHILFVAGVFSFALMIGLVGDSISTQAALVAQSNDAIVERKHTVVVGWNDAAASLLRQVSQRQRAGSLFVVLSELDREQVQTAAEEALAGSRSRVIVRQGSPGNLRDLQKVCAGSAAHVVLLHADGAAAGDAAAAAEASKAMSLMGLTPVRGQQPPRVTVEMMGSPRDDLVAAAMSARARAGGSGALLAQRTSLVDARGSLARTLAACATHPGLAAVYADGLAAGAEGAGLHAVTLPSHLHGKTFGDAWRAYAQPVAGYLRRDPGGDWRVRMAPPEGEQLLKGDSLVVLAAGKADAGAAARNAPWRSKSSATVPVAAPAPGEAMHMVVAGLERTGMADDLLQSLAAHAAQGPAGSTVSVLSSSLTSYDVGRFTNARCRFTLVSGSSGKRSDLLKAGAAKANHVLLLAPPGSNERSGQTATLASLLLLQDIVAGTGAHARAPLHVVATLSGDNSAAAAARLAHASGGALALDLVDVHRLAAGAMAADVADARAPRAAQALLRGGGAELALRPVTHYLPPSATARAAKPMTGWQLAEAVRAQGDVAVGWRAADDEAAVIVGGNRADKRTWTARDLVLVVAATGCA